MLKSAEIVLPLQTQQEKTKITQPVTETALNDNQWNMPVSNHCRGRKAHVKYKPT